ncbi:toll-like receptor 4 [Argonauta hians]
MNIQQSCLKWILPFQVIAVLSLNDTFYVRQNCSINEFPNIVCRNIDLHNKHLNFEKLNGTFALYLIGTNLQTLEENMFNGIKLESLSISKNPLTMINKNAFNGQEDSLKRLTLSTTNTSVQVDFTVLQSLHNLETLEIKKFKMNENLNNFTSNNLSKLKNLSLIENKIHNISENVFQSLGNLTKLVIKQNEMEKLLDPQIFVHLNSIEFLDLSNNAIREISKRALENNESKLKFFNISHNKITEDHLKHFKNLSELEILILDNNQITSLGGNIFQNMNQLKTLSVKYNQLTKLHKTHLSGLNNLEKLVLNNNLLLIESSAMEALPHLETLYLENQQLNETMSMDWLENTNGWIKKLYLKGNRLNVKQLWKSIKTLAHLEVLDLSSCHLNEIPLFAFEKNTRLELLKLNDNEIETLREGTFEGLQNSLESIQLASNQLQLVDECVFNNFSWPDREFFNIDFSNNKLQCNCSLQWLQDQLKEFLKRHNDAMYQFQFWTCFNSTENIVKAELNCQSNSSDAICEDFGMRYTTQPITLPPPEFSSKIGDPQISTNLATTVVATTTVRSFERPNISIDIQKLQSEVVKIEWKISDTFWVKDFTLKIEEIFPNHTRKTYNIPVHVLRRSQIYHYLSNQSILHICIVINVKTTSNIIEACDTLTPNVMTTTHANPSNNKTLEIGLGAAVAVALVILAVLLSLFYIRRKNKKHTYEDPKTTTRVDAMRSSKRSERQIPEENKSPTVTVVSHGRLQPGRPVSAGSYQYFSDPNSNTEHTYEDVNAQNLTDETSNKDDKRLSYQNLSVDNFQKNNQTCSFVNRPLPCPPETPNYVNVPKYLSEAKETKI